MSAGQETLAEQVKGALRDVSVAEAMVTDVQTIAPDTALDTAAARLSTSFQHDFPVVDGDVVIGMLTRDDVLRGLTAHRPSLTVGEVMHHHYAMAGSGEDLDSVLGRLPPDGSSVVVLHDDRLVGLLDPEHIGELLAMREAVHGDCDRRRHT